MVIWIYLIGLAVASFYLGAVMASGSWKGRRQ